MKNKDIRLSDMEKAEPCAGPEMDYTPKEHTLRDQVIYGVKLFSFLGFFFLLFWLWDKFSG